MTSATTQTASTLAEKLTAAHRCDRCGAQAYIRASLPSGGVLLFCAHHGREVENKLRPMTNDWHDETARLLEDATEPV